ncbi:hypothetical protein [uncultured Mediterranean phage]|nr:hypothetical protein [uncultured Mediterranean phage]
MAENAPPPQESAFSKTQSFLKSDSFFAKLAFIILVLIVFYYLLQAVLLIIRQIFGSSGHVHVFKGIKNGTKSVTIKQDPKIKGSVPILRSDNRKSGIEFTYSVWLNIYNLEPIGQRKHIFHKGNDAPLDNMLDDDGMYTPNNSPGLYLHERENKLIVAMNTFNKVKEEITIDNIPFNKWINLAIVVKQKIVDVHINGTLAKRHELSGLPKQNYGNVYINKNGGFHGSIANLSYYNYSLGPAALRDQAAGEPNFKVDNKNIKNYPPYFSLGWYTNKSN